MTEFTIPLGALADFQATVKKLNKKAIKYGTAPITVEVLRETIVEHSHTTKIEGREVTRRYPIKAAVISLNGPTPTVGGFKFLARVEYLSDGNSSLIHAAPGSDVKVDDRFRSMPRGTCEHCNSRRFRKETFVVLNSETGEQKLVGRQCLNDYTGLITVEQLAGIAACLNSYSRLSDEADGSWGRGLLDRHVDTREMLALSSAYISLLGWVPKSLGTGESTAGKVVRHFWNARLSDFERAEMRRADEALSNPLHYDRADAVIAWIKNDLSRSARSDYEQNLVTLVSNDLTEDKHAGLVCSAVAAYQRAMNQKVEYAKKREEATKSRFVGTVGERMRGIDVKVTFVKMMEAGQFGPSTLIKFSDTNGNLLTWFASGDREYQVGSSLKIDATVKSHKEYQGIQETQVSRVKALIPEGV